MNNNNNLNLIWIDLEMTGLNTNRDHIIEIATIVTDKDLNILAEGPILAIHQPEEVLSDMDSWNTRQHNESGLAQRVRDSTVTPQEAEKATMTFLEKFVPPNCSPMCGNSICQDRRFLAREMPTLEAYFHYRNLDVSTIKEIARRWRPEILGKQRKVGAHIALEDIRDSIEELRFYRLTFFNLDS